MMTDLKNQPLSTMHATYHASRFTDVTTFEQMNLHRLLLRGMDAYGFKTPSTIQKQAIRPCILGHDVITQAPSGEGKTSTLVISILQRLNLHVEKCQVIILEPTRALALRTQNMIDKIGSFMIVTHHACVGGMHLQRQHLDRLEAGVQIVIGTPGCIYDTFNHSKYCYETLQIVALNHVNQLLNHGFQDLIYDFWKILPNKIQTLLFSDTRATEVTELSDRIMINPIQIEFHEESLILNGVQHYYIPVDNEEDKNAALSKCCDNLPFTGAIIIFCDMYRRLDSIVNQIRRDDRAVTVIHSDMTGRERNEAIQQITTGFVQYLVTTDIIAPYQCLTNLRYIVHYDIPLHPQTYLRRIGKSAQCDRKYVSIAIVADHEEGRIHRIECFYNTTIQSLPPNIPVQSLCFSVDD